MSVFDHYLLLIYIYYSSKIGVTHLMLTLKFGSALNPGRSISVNLYYCPNVFLPFGRTAQWFA